MVGEVEVAFVALMGAIQTKDSAETFLQLECSGSLDTADRSGRGHALVSHLSD